MRKRAIAWGLLPFAGMILLVGGCDMPSTFAPSVEIATNLPLLGERVEIGEKIADAESIRENPLVPNELQIHFEREEINLGDGGYVGGDRLTVDSQAPDVMTAEVGVIKVDDVSPSYTPETRLDVIASDFVNQFPPATVIPTVPGDNLPTSKEEITFDKFTSVTFSNSDDATLNNVVISFSNHTPLTMGPVEIFLSNSGDTTATGDVTDYYAYTVIAAVAPGATESSDPIVLSNATVNSPTYVITRTAFQTGTNINSDEVRNGYFLTAVDISELEVVEAVAQIPAQEFNQSQSRSLTHSQLELIEVELAEASHPDTNRFQMAITNNIATPVNIRFDIPDFASIPYTPFTSGSGVLTPETPNDWSRASIALGANESIDIVYNLDGAIIKNSTVDRAPIGDLEIDLNVEILGTGNDFVHIQSTDAATVVTNMGALAIQRVTGLVPSSNPITSPISEFDFVVDESMPEGIAGIQARRIRAALDIVTHDIRGVATIRLVMTVDQPNLGDQTGYYEPVIHAVIEPGTVVPFVVTEDSLDAYSNSPLSLINAMISNVFNNGYGRMLINGEVAFEDTVVLVRDASRIEIRDMNIETPLMFDVPVITFDARSSDQDGFDLDLGDGVREDMIPRAKGMALVAHVKNHFPLGGRLTLYISPDPRFLELRNAYPASAQTPLNQIPDVLPTDVNIENLDEVQYRQAVYSLFTIELPEPQRLADGSADDANPGETTVLITLSEPEIQLFSLENSYILPRIQLIEEPGLVKLEADDYLEIDLWAQLKATTKK